MTSRVACAIGLHAPSGICLRDCAPANLVRRVLRQVLRRPGIAGVHSEIHRYHVLHDRLYVITNGSPAIVIARDGIKLCAEASQQCKASRCAPIDCQLVKRIDLFPPFGSQYRNSWRCIVERRRIVVLLRRRLCGRFSLVGLHQLFHLQAYMR